MIHFGELDCCLENLKRKMSLFYLKKVKRKLDFDYLSSSFVDEIKNASLLRREKWENLSIISIQLQIKSLSEFKFRLCLCLWMGDVA